METAYSSNEAKKFYQEVNGTWKTETTNINGLG